MLELVWHVINRSWFSFSTLNNRLVQVKGFRLDSLLRTAHVLPGLGSQFQLQQQSPLFQENNPRIRFPPAQEQFFQQPIFPSQLSRQQNRFSNNNFSPSASDTSREQLLRWGSRERLLDHQLSLEWLLLLNSFHGTCLLDNLICFPPRLWAPLFPTYLPLKLHSLQPSSRTLFSKHSSSQTTSSNNRSKSRDWDLEMHFLILDFNNNINNNNNNSNSSQNRIETERSWCCRPGNVS